MFVEDPFMTRITGIQNTVPSTVEVPQSTLATPLPPGTDGLINAVDSGFEVGTDKLPSQDVGGSLQRATALFRALPPRDDVTAMRRQFRDYVDTIPYDVKGNLKEAHPPLYRALSREADLNRCHWRVGLSDKKEAIHNHIFYLGQPQASRIIVSLTGAPITAGYLVPFFERVARELGDPNTAFVLLPSCAELEAEFVLYHLQRLNKNIEKFDFFTHSGGSLTLHKIQRDGYLPENTTSFCALGWVYRHDYETRDPASYRPNKIKIPEFVRPQSLENQGLIHPMQVKKMICSIGQYYFPDFIWSHRPTRDHLIRTFVDGVYLRRILSGLSELQDFKQESLSYARQVTALARQPGMQFLIFAGTDDDVVSEKHSRAALAKLSGVTTGSIPRDEPWQSGPLSWHPIVGGKHLPMFERTDEMVKVYVKFLSK